METGPNLWLPTLLLKLYLVEASAKDLNIPYLAHFSQKFPLKNVTKLPPTGTAPDNFPDDGKELQTLHFCSQAGSLFIGKRELKGFISMVRRGGFS